MVIRKIKRQYILYTKKMPRRRLGIFRTRAAALVRERQINYFRHINKK